MAILDYWEQKKADDIMKAAERKVQEMKGKTEDVKRLTKLIGFAEARMTSIQDPTGKGMQDYLPTLARRQDILDAVYKDMIGDTQNYFGDLDHRIIRYAWEWEALNDRQRQKILTSYPWMHEELISQELPGAVNDEWYEPLTDIYEAMTPKEQSYFTPADRMTMQCLIELRGVSNQPVYLNRATGEVLHRPSILATL